MRRPQFAAAVKARAINTATSPVDERMTINELNKIAESRLVGRGEERGRDRDWFVLNLYRRLFFMSDLNQNERKTGYSQDDLFVSFAHSDNLPCKS